MLTMPHRLRPKSVAIAGGAALVAAVDPTYDLLAWLLTPSSGDAAPTILIVYPALHIRLLGIAVAVGLAFGLCAWWGAIPGRPPTKVAALAAGAAAAAVVVRAAELSRMAEANDAARLWLTAVAVVVPALTLVAAHWPLAAGGSATAVDN